MSTFLWDPFTALARINDEFDELVSKNFGFGRALAPAQASGFVPAVEMSTDDQDVLIRVELPGLDVERDVEVEVLDGRLVVHGERRDEHTDKGRDGLLVRELRYGAFRREFALPEGVGPEQVEASYDAGLLTIRVKGVAATPRRQRTKIAITGTPGTQVEGGQPKAVSGGAEPAATS